MAQQDSAATIIKRILKRDFAIVVRPPAVDTDLFEQSLHSMSIELQCVEQALILATPGTNLDYEVLLII